MLEILCWGVGMLSAFRLLVPLGGFTESQAREHLEFLWKGHSREDLQHRVSVLRQKKIAAGAATACSSLAAESTGSHPAEGRTVGE